MGFNFNIAGNIAADDDGNDAGASEYVTYGFGRTERVKLSVGGVLIIAVSLSLSIIFQYCFSSSMTFRALKEKLSWDKIWKVFFL